MADNLFEQKKEVRTHVLDARFKLSPEDRMGMSRRIEEKLFSLPEFQAASTIMFFASFRSEVETHDMIRHALAAKKRVVLPRIKGKDLALFQIKDFDRDVAPGAWEIPEPAYGKPVDLDKIDLIVTPGVAFDESGNRLGNGGGFYDKILAVYPGMTVGIAFDIQIIPHVPMAQYDVPVKKIVTEKRVINTAEGRGGF